jgi:hypothetical protein
MTAKLIGLVLIVAGGALLYFGINATESPVEALSQSLTGRYSDQTMIYLIGGGVLAVVGLAMLFKGR